jgi:modulator of FtsH protease HflC
MNRGLPSLIAGTLLVVILGLYMVTYQVRFTEVAVLKTFGKADPTKDVIKEPGLYWKWPWPIQSVDVYDNRIQLSATTGEEMSTQDGKPVIVTTAIGWRIDDPYVFNRTCGTMKEGENRLQTLVRNIQKSVLSQYGFHSFVSTDPKELQYDEVEKELQVEVAKQARALYGMQVESTGIEKFALPQRITQTVFDAMKKERQTQSARYTSEGESQAKTIKETAEATANTILSFADRKAMEIVSEGLRRANQYNEEFRKDQPLAMFLLKVQNLPKILKERSTTLVLDENSPLLDLLFGKAAGTGPTTRPAGPQAGSDVALPEIIRPAR